MTTVALILALLALVIAGLAWWRVQRSDRRLRELAADVSRYRSELLDVRAREIAGTQAMAEERGPAPLPAASFDLSMTIAEAMALHPGVRSVLGQFQLGSCSDCAVSDVDTLEGACRSYGVDPQALTAALAQLVSPAVASNSRTHYGPTGS